MRELESIKDGLKTERGTLIGCGYLYNHITDDFKWCIPEMPFFVTKGEEDYYIATNCGLVLDGYGSTADNAISDMISNSAYFLKTNFVGTVADSAWDNLLDLRMSNEQTKRLRDHFHIIQLHIYSQGKEAIDFSKIEKAKHVIGGMTLEFTYTKYTASP